MSIDEAEEALRAAQLAGDVDALDRLLDDALVFVALDGGVVTKADDLAMHRSKRLGIEKLEPSDRHVAQHDDVAVVSVKMSAVAVIDGQRHQNVLRYTRFWSRKSGAWKIIGGHMSQLA